MNNLDPHEVEKLIGGYATGTLTDAEQQALFSEALGNQALFDALADEEALRELLSDPVARRQLLATLAPAKKEQSFLQRFSAWLFRPLTMSLVAGAAAAGLAIIIVPRLTEGPKVEQVALSRPATTPADPAAPPQPVPEQSVVPSPAEADRPPEPAMVLSAKKKAARDPVVPPSGEPVAGAAGGRSARIIVALPPSARGTVPVSAPLADTMQPGAPREQERKVALARREDVAAPAADAQAPPPPPAPAAAAPSPAPAKELAAQREMVAKSASAAVVPFEYILERQSADGSWAGIEPTARLRAKDQVRVSVQANAPGSLSVDLRTSGGETRTLYRAATRAGQRFYVPPQGGMPAAEGEHRLVISYTPGPSLLGLALRQRAVAENRAGAGKAETSRDEAGAAPPYSVEIPLRFR